MLEEGKCWKCKDVEKDPHSVPCIVPCCFVVVSFVNLAKSYISATICSLGEKKRRRKTFSVSFFCFLRKPLTWHPITRIQVMGLNYDSSSGGIGGFIIFFITIKHSNKNNANFVESFSISNSLSFFCFSMIFTCIIIIRLKPPFKLSTYVPFTRFNRGFHHQVWTISLVL